VVIIVLEVTNRYWDYWTYKRKVTVGINCRQTDDENMWL